MTKELAERLLPIFKKDFKKARFKAGCVTMYPNLNNAFKNKSAERRYDRLTVLFELTKQLYLECLGVLGRRTH